MPLANKLPFHLADERDRPSKTHESEAQKIARDFLDPAVLQRCAPGH
jgi:hypothetical protein